MGNIYQAEILRLRKLLEIERRNARTDVLTGLQNRFSYYECTQAACQDGVSFGLIFFDAANLHTANKLLGYDRADGLLQRIAESIRSPEEDCAFRIGGDEFTVVLSGVTSLTKVESIRDRIEARVGRFSLNATSSFFLVGGCTVVRPGEVVAEKQKLAERECEKRKMDLKRSRNEVLTREEP